MEKEDRFLQVDRELLEDENFLAFQLAQVQKVFVDVAPGTWVAYQKGKLLGMAESWDALMEEIANDRENGEDVMVDQVNVEKSVKNIRRGQRLAKNQGE